jgi:hypothetical protein
MRTFPQPSGIATFSSDPTYQKHMRRAVDGGVVTQTTCDAHIPDSSAITWRYVKMHRVRAPPGKDDFRYVPEELDRAGEVLE